MADPPAAEALPKLGLMTSLPLYWPLESDFTDLAQGNGEVPWQRELIERQFEILPLDTLSAIPTLSSDQPDTDPLEGIEYLAVIQPRGLSPADNVALDDWVRAGGQLLLVLDPALTGDYDLALGDPRRPVDTALVPPVVSRWGLESSFDPDQEQEVAITPLPGGIVPLVVSGQGRVAGEVGKENGCQTLANPALLRCDSVGEGTVIYLLDAAVFEHAELAGEDGKNMRTLLNFAFRLGASGENTGIASATRKDSGE